MSEAPEKEFAVGDRVYLASLPPYVKTAEPMPMLRPPNVVYLGEEGIVIDRRPGGFWSVRFSKGTFLIDSHYIERATPKDESHLGSATP
jgi:hypothetical protein